MDQLKLEDLETEASALGFCFIGASKPQPPDHFNVFLRWLENGNHGMMVYLEKEESKKKRFDPHLIFPEVKTILSLAFPYPISPFDEKPVDEKFRGKISTYALGDDYHRWIPQKLSVLIDRMEKLSGRSINCKILVDSAPFLEREYAAYSGMGWIGKNSCLINPSFGSFFFLCEMLLNVEVEAHSSFLYPDYCGICSRCIDACPTQCIQPDRTIRARECISYLTIENRVSIPRHLREKMGSWIFGCDVCQSVCPWNQKAARELGTKEKPASEWSVSLFQESQISAEEFSSKYRNSPIRRAKYEGFLRNISVALGNTRHPEAIVPLSRLIYPPYTPLVRRHAAWALGEIDSMDAIKTLKQASKSEENGEVLLEISQALQISESRHPIG